MFVLDGQYSSKELLDYLEESGEPVLDNGAARDAARSRNLNLAAAPAPGERIVAASELHLDDVKAICDDGTRRAIGLCKDKAAMRRALRPLYPDYAFAEYTADELRALDPDALPVPYPLIVKPATGFFSLGIYPVRDRGEWLAALEDIAAHADEWPRGYNRTVVDGTRFLVEQAIQGDEFALDCYYDDAGEPVILNIFAHDFAGGGDVSDRLYYTSARVMRGQLGRMERFLRDANELLGFRAFPVHIEVRVDAAGQVVPIEFNPLRFAGLCNTDLSWFAWGHKTYECYLRDLRPDRPALLAGKEGLNYAMVIPQKEGFDATQPYTFDYDAFAGCFSRLLDLRKLDYATQGAFCFAFAEISDQDWEAEAGRLLRSTLDEFLA